MEVASEKNVKKNLYKENIDVLIGIPWYSYKSEVRSLNNV